MPQRKPSITTLEGTSLATLSHALSSTSVPFISVLPFLFSFLTLSSSAFFSYPLPALSPSLPSFPPSCPPSSSHCWGAFILFLSEVRSGPSGLEWFLLFVSLLRTKGLSGGEELSSAVISWADCVPSGYSSVTTPHLDPRGKCHPHQPASVEMERMAGFLFDTPIALGPELDKPSPFFLSLLPPFPFCFLRVSFFP